MVEPEYPLAEAFIPARYFGQDGAPSRLVNTIVIHCTDGQADARRTAEYFAGGSEGRKSSAHFVIGQIGEVIQCVPLAGIAYHAHAANRVSIGIEHCARTRGEFGPNDQGLLPSMAQYRASARLVAWLCDRYGISRDRRHILGHREADPTTTHTGCPDSAGWQWDAYMGLVVAA